MAHTHSVIDDDLHFIIDPSTRDIGNGSKKVKLMQYDHNSEQFTFEIPRFVEGHDMSLCNSIRVNYININKSTREQHPGVYEVSNIQVEEDNIIFSWLVSRNATQYVGPLSFLIKFMCFDEGGYITYEWHTDIFKNASVFTGMNNEESIEEVYPDILEKWKSDVLAEEASRIVAESERVTAESERVAAESERVAAESERVTAESKRVTAESERVTAESERVTAESERVTSESKRVTSESERVAAESERVAAESERVTAESERANTFAGYETEINQFKNEIVTGKDSATDNTRFAIGVAEQNLEVPSMEEFNQLKDEKLSEPAEGIAVGKYFRVAAIDENGHAVLEAVDAKDVGVQDVQVAGASVVADGVAVIPNTGINKYGLVKLTYGDSSGTTFANDTIYVIPALNNTIENRKPENGYTSGPNNRHAIVPAHLDYAVKAAMCDGKGAAWTADEQAAARERMGIYNYNAIAVITLAEDSKPIIDLGAEYKKLFIVFKIPAGDTCISNNYIYDQNHRSIAFFPANTLFYNHEKFATSIIDKNGEYWTCDTNYGSNNSAANSGSNRSAYKIVSETLTTIRFSNPIRAGSEIQIYGVRA